MGAEGQPWRSTTHRQVRCLVGWLRSVAVGCVGAGIRFYLLPALLLLRSSCANAALQLRSCDATVMLLLCYCYATAMLLLCYSYATAMLLIWF